MNVLTACFEWVFSACNNLWSRVFQKGFNLPRKRNQIMFSFSNLWAGGQLHGWTQNGRIFISISTFSWNRFCLFSTEQPFYPLHCVGWSVHKRVNLGVDASKGLTRCGGSCFRGKYELQKRENISEMKNIGYARGKSSISRATVRAYLSLLTWENSGGKNCIT